MPVMKHIHTYERVKGVWCCNSPDCSHYMPTNVRGGDVEGMKSVCNNCGIFFILTHALMNLKGGPLWQSYVQPDFKPVCEACAILNGSVIPDELVELYMEKGEITDEDRAEAVRRLAQK